MAVRIRLKLIGRRKRPAYRVVVAYSKSPRGGRALEDVGHYGPLLDHDDPNRVVLSIDRINHWLSKGAQMTERVAVLYKRSLANLNVDGNAESSL